MEKCVNDATPHISGVHFFIPSFTFLISFIPHFSFNIVLTCIASIIRA
jgi:hypothetical protein